MLLMKPSVPWALTWYLLYALMPATKQSAQSAPAVLNPNLQIRLASTTTNSSGQSSVRVAKDPRNNQLYYVKINGDIYKVDLQSGGGSTSTKVYSATDHGLSGSVQGLAIGPYGTIYIVGNTTTNNTLTYARI